MVKLPDETKIDKATGEHIDEIQRRIGGYLAGWATVESSFIGILRVLLKADIDTAAVVFHSAGAGRSRMKLIENLVYLKLRGDVRETALSLLKEFKSHNGLRNELAHAEYVFPMQATIIVQLDGYKGGPIAKPRAFDKARLNEIRHQMGRMMGLNQKVIDFLPELANSMKAQPPAPPASPLRSR